MLARAAGEVVTGDSLAPLRAGYTGGVTSTDGPAGAIERARAACVNAALELTAAGVSPDALAEYVPPRRVLIATKKATMRPIGEAWRIGTILLASDGTLYALGSSTRAAERGRPGYQSLSREERRDIAAAALRGGYPEGTSVAYDATPLPLAVDSPVVTGAGDADPQLPIGYADGEIRIRWRTGAPLAGAQPLAAFLRERVALLIDPLHGAGA